MSTTLPTRTTNTARKQRRKLQLRSKHRRRSNKTKKKPIGLKSGINNYNNNNNETDTNNIGVIIKSQSSHPRTNSNTLNNSFLTPESETIATDTTSSSISTSNASTISSSPSGKKMHHNRRKNRRPVIGLNKGQKKRQQDARNQKKNEKYLRRRRNRRKIKISAHTINSLDVDDILTMHMREELNIDSSVHIIRDLGKHKIHIHTCMHMQINGHKEILRINGNIKQFKCLKVNDILEIGETQKLTLKISEIDSSGATNWSLSIDSLIAKQWNLSQQMLCDISLINPLSLELLQVEVLFKNQYISRGKQWKIETDLINRIVHVNEYINCVKDKGYDISIKSMKSLALNGQIVSCGLITKNTKFLFRSNSAWFMYLIQLSQEMWDFNKKQIHFEKFIDGFLKTIMTKWKENECNHVYSIIFFSRTFYENDHVHHMPTYSNPSPSTTRKTKVFNKDSDNRYYQDHYMVVVRNWCTNNWNKLSQKLREAFDTFPLRVKWNRGLSQSSQSVSVAAEGNLLEAIQLSLNVLDKHYVDRDLYRTGMSINVVTAGNGLYFVDKSLATFTKVRILNNGINCNIVSMTRPPLHPTPLFVYGSPLAFKENKWETLSYYQPIEMMQIKFFDYNPYNESPIVAPQQLYKKPASFLALKRESKTFVPLLLRDPPQNINAQNSGFNTIYLQNNAQNLDSINLERNETYSHSEYDDQIFAPNVHSALINNGTQTYKKAMKSQAHATNMNNTNNYGIDSPGGSFGNLPPLSVPQIRRATISKRRASNNTCVASEMSCISCDKLSSRMFNYSAGDIDDDNLSQNEDEAAVDDGAEPNVGVLKEMFNAPKEDVDDLNQNVGYIDHVIVIQHRDSYQQQQEKNTLSALDPSNTTPFNTSANTINSEVKTCDISDIDLDENSNGPVTPPTATIEKKANNIHPFKLTWSEDNYNERNKRFGCIYPSAHEYCGFLFPSYNSSWISFISPAILPLTNDISFNSKVLNCSKNVYKSNWQIGTINEYTLTEMVLQRITQDFQLMRVKENEEEGIGDRIRTHVLNTQTYIHKLKHISTDPNITITRYVDNRLADKESKILSQKDNILSQKKDDQQLLTTFSLAYNYNLWNDHREIFQNFTVKLSEKHQLYDWTKLDQVCAGYCDDIENDLKARRIRFALIPTANNKSDNFIQWFTKITATTNIKQTGICIINQKSSYYSPSKWCQHVHGSSRCRLKIELPSEWKGRNTFLILKYDKIYDPHIVFHFQIYWLVATGHQICSFIDNMEKEANKLDLHLIPVPSAQFQAQKIADPFSKTLTVESQTRKLSKNCKIHLQNALMDKFGFILDSNSGIRGCALQFMHRSGCCILRWQDGGFLRNVSFTWLVNNYRCDSQQCRIRSIQLFRDFRKYFHEKIAIYQHVDHIINNLLVNRCILHQ